MTDSTRFKTNFIYFCSMLALLLLRIASALGLLNLGIEWFGQSRVFSVVSQVICMGLVPLTLYFVLLTKRKHRLEQFKKDFCLRGFDRRNILEIAVICIAAVYVTTCVSSVWNGALELIGFRSGSSSTSGTATAGYVLVQIVLVAILPAIFEETTNRGILGVAYSGKQYILLSAAMFALMHQNVTQTGYTFVAGVVMASLVYYTGSIIPSVFYHFFNNLISVLRANTNILNFVNKFFGFALGPGVGGALGTVLFLLSLELIALSFKRIKDRKPLPLPRYTVTEFAAYLNYPEKKHSRADDLFLYITVAMNVVATVFSFVWGLLR